jgi:UDP-sugar pyrophosphorylase
LKASGFPDGDVNGPDGFSPFPGNINQLVLKIAPYAETIQRTGGLVPEFVNPKYADAAKTKFKKAARLECMMQEHPKVMSPDQLVGFTTFPEWTYSPVKNSVDEARAKINMGAPGRSAAEGELEYYDAGYRALEAAGVPVPARSVLGVFGFSLPAPPQIVFAPKFAVSFNVFKSKFPTPSAVRISSRSTLVIDGSDVTIESLDLDGALVIRAVEGAKVVVRNAKVENQGWPLVPLSDGDQTTDAIKIRGFHCVRKEARVCEFTAPGTYFVE